MQRLRLPVPEASALVIFLLNCDTVDSVEFLNLDSLSFEFLNQDTMEYGMESWSFRMGIHAEVGLELLHTLCNHVGCRKGFSSVGFSE